MFSMNTEKYFTGALAIFFACGFGFHMVPAWYPFARETTELFLAFSGGIVLYFVFLINSPKRMLAWLLISLILTWFLEVMGTNTGMIFGDYRYTGTLGVQLLNVPVVIALNWVVLTLGMSEIVRAIVRKDLWVPPLAAVFLVFFDLLLEPMAMKLNYWQWNDRFVPLQNYLAWFVIAFLLSALLIRLRIRTGTLILRAYIIIQFLFFGLLYFFF